MMALKTLAAAGLAVAVLAGCAIPNSRAVPDDVSLLNDRLSVSFSNGVRCRVEGISEQPTGTLTGCPIPAQYDVRMQRPGYFGDVITEPYADILITDASGRVHLFKTPGSRNWSARLGSDEG